MLLITPPVVALDHQAVRSEVHRPERLKTVTVSDRANGVLVAALSGGEKTILSLHISCLCGVFISSLTRQATAH